MFDAQHDFAAVVYDDHQDPDAVLRDFAASLNAQGLRMYALEVGYFRDSDEYFVPRLSVVPPATARRSRSAARCLDPRSLREPPRLPPVGQRRALLPATNLGVDLLPILAPDPIVDRPAVL